MSDGQGQYLRVLAVLAEPLSDPSGQGMPAGNALDMRSEWLRLAQAMRSNHDALSGTGAPWSLERLNPPGDPALRRTLRRGYEVLHISCHASANGVVLEDDRCREQPLSNQQLVDIITGEPERIPQLVVLNACQTLPLARALHAAGVPAIIATEQPLYDDEAHALATELYTELASSATVGQALRATQSAIDRQCANYPERDRARRVANVVLVGDATLKLPRPAQPAPSFRLIESQTSLASVPEARADFVGRRDVLIQIANWMQDGQSTVFVLSGIGGAGKTTVAVQAANRFGYRFRHVAFASALGVPNFGLSQIGDALFTALELPRTADDSRDLAGAIVRLLNTAGQSVLLVLDNLESVSPDDASAIADVLQRIRSTSGSKALLTLRPQQHPPLTKVAGTRAHQLERLAEGDALRLLWTSLGEQGEDRRGAVCREAASAPHPAYPAELLATLRAEAQLPDTIRQPAIAELHHMATTLAHGYPAFIRLSSTLVLEKDWAAARERLEQLRGEDVVKALQALIGTMLEQARQHAPQLPDLLLSASVFAAPASLPDLFQVLHGAPWNAEYAIEFDDELVTPAVRSSLLRRDDGRYSLEMPVRDFLRHWLHTHPEQQEQHDLRHLRHARLFASIVADYNTAIGEGRMTYAAPLAFADVSAALEWLTARPVTDREAMILLCAMLNHGANVFRNGYVPRYMHWLQQALSGAQQQGLQQEEANTLQAIGEVYRMQAAYADARAAYDAALPLFRAITDRLGEATTLGSISRVVLQTGDEQQAATLLEQSVTILEQIGASYNAGVALGNYGVSLLAQGRGAAALPYLRRARALFAANPQVAHVVAMVDRWIAQAEGE